jgi:hypothetical protein
MGGIVVAIGSEKAGELVWGQAVSQGVQHLLQGFANVLGDAARRGYGASHQTKRMLKRCDNVSARIHQGAI